MRNLVFSLCAVALFTTVVLYAVHSKGEDLGFFQQDDNIMSVGNSKGCIAEIEAIADIGGLSQTGDYYFGNGAYDLECAKYAFFKSIAIDPQGDARNWHQLGRIDFLEGKFVDAINKFNRQIEYFGEQMPNVYYMLGLTYGYSAKETNNLDEWANAEEAFKKYIELNPSSPWPRIDLSWVYFAQGKFIEMEQHLSEAQKYDPNNPWLLNMFGLMFLNTDRRKEAVEYFDRALIESKHLTPEQWGEKYPGNDPRSYAKGLALMQEAIEHNLSLAKK